MITFQLDQNVNKRSLAETCQKEGKAGVWRFPKKWSTIAEGFKDPDLLPVVMAGDKPLVTNDRNIAKENARFIPSKNPGIAIVGFAKGTIKPLGRGDIEKILVNFKAQFPRWHLVSWSNSVVEITQNSVEVWHVEAGNLGPDDYWPMTQPGWPNLFEAVLRKNASRLLDPHQAAQLNVDPNLLEGAD
jgi:hypothetical protein